MACVEFGCLSFRETGAPGALAQILRKQGAEGKRPEGSRLCTVRQMGYLAGATFNSVIKSPY